MHRGELTGAYPSESRVYGLAGEGAEGHADKSLPGGDACGGYATGRALPTQSLGVPLSPRAWKRMVRGPIPSLHFIPAVYNVVGNNPPLHQDSGLAAA